MAEPKVVPDQDALAKLWSIKERYDHWNTNPLSPNYVSSDCSDIGTDCHGDGECGGDGE